MSLDDSTAIAQCLPWLQKFWEDVWGEELALKRKQTVTDGEAFDYLDLTEHSHHAVNYFCPPAPEKLYIFLEYLTAFNTFQNNLNTYERGACIIGQPDIGKTCFIVYAVVERLRKKEPVAVDVTNWDKYTEWYLLFAAGGVTLHRGLDTDPLERQPGIWAFSDSNATILIPMSAVMYTLGVRTFQVTSPKEVRHKEWTKQNKVQ